jgi:hypothetical protein
LFVYKIYHTVKENVTLKLFITKLGFYLEDGFEKSINILLHRSTFLSSPLHPEWLRGPTSLLSNGYHRLFPWGVKWLGHEAVHSPLSSAKVKE